MLALALSISKVYVIVAHPDLVKILLRNVPGPSMMPGGSKEGYDAIAHIVEKVAAQVDDGPCVTYIGPGGAGKTCLQYTIMSEARLLHCIE